MNQQVCRLLPYSIVQGARNMAADEVLLEAAHRGTASLRFYGWSEPTLSLGYFQSERVRFEEPLLAPLPFVRRATGGATLVHHHEVTYGLALPVGSPWHDKESWLGKMHSIIQGALLRFEISSALQPPVEREPFRGVLCFQHLTPGDLLIGSSKVVGSAQRKQRGALLQHGAILLERSEFTPALPGIANLCGRKVEAADVCEAVTREFALQTDCVLRREDWSIQELERIDELVNAKYGSEKWTHKR